MRESVNSPYDARNFCFASFSNIKDYHGPESFAKYMTSSREFANNAARSEYIRACIASANEEFNRCTSGKVCVYYGTGGVDVLHTIPTMGLVKHILAASYCAHFKLKHTGYIALWDWDAKSKGFPENKMFRGFYGNVIVMTDGQYWEFSNNC